MIVKMFERCGLIRFGHFTDEEITILLDKGWTEVHSCNFDKPNIKRHPLMKVVKVGVSKNGIPIYEKRKILQKC